MTPELRAEMDAEMEEQRRIIDAIFSEENFARVRAIEALPVDERPPLCVPLPPGWSAVNKGPGYAAYTGETLRGFL